MVSACKTCRQSAWKTCWVCSTQSFSTAQPKKSTALEKYKMYLMYSLAFVLYYKEAYVGLFIAWGVSSFSFGCVLWRLAGAQNITFPVETYVLGIMENTLLLVILFTWFVVGRIIFNKHVKGCDYARDVYVGGLFLAVALLCLFLIITFSPLWLPSM